MLFTVKSTPIWMIQQYCKKLINLGFNLLALNLLAWMFFKLSFKLFFQPFLLYISGRMRLFWHHFIIITAFIFHRWKMKYMHMHMLLFRSSHPEVLCKKGILRNFVKLTGKHLCQSLFFNKHFFYRTSLDD